MPLLILYVIVINLVAYGAMAIDKRRAQGRTPQRRVPEATLLRLGWAGGSLGLWIGMRRLRHKTQKVRFTRTVPVMLVVHLFVLLFVVNPFGRTRLTMAMGMAVGKTAEILARSWGYLEPYVPFLPK
mgnify:CR=1 FL=1